MLTCPLYLPSLYIIIWNWLNSGDRTNWRMLVWAWPVAGSDCSLGLGPHLHHVRLQRRHGLHLHPQQEYYQIHQDEVIFAYQSLYVHPLFPTRFGRKDQKFRKQKRKISRQKNSGHGDEEQFYRVADVVLILLFPTSFLIFNSAYWYYYLYSYESFLPEYTINWASTNMSSAALITFYFLLVSKSVHPFHKILWYVPSYRIMYNVSTPVSDEDHKIFNKIYSNMRIFLH